MLSFLFIRVPWCSYELQKPGCIFCLKLIIICFSLSHFCDMFWNGTMIMNICFIWQFGVHSNNFETVLQKTTFWGTQGAQKSQQEPKTYLKLFLTLTESGWLWLTQTNSGWLLMTLANSGCQPESIRVSQSQPESARVSQSQLVSAIDGWMWPRKFCLT